MLRLSSDAQIIIFHPPPIQAKSMGKKEEEDAGAQVLSVDVGKKIAILTTPGQPEKTVPVAKGPRGFCTADFGWGPVVTEMPNLLFDAKPEQKAIENVVKKRPAAKPTRKRPAAKPTRFGKKAKLPSAEEDGKDVEVLEEAIEVAEDVVDKKASEDRACVLFWAAGILVEG